MSQTKSPPLPHQATPKIESKSSQTLTRPFPKEIRKKNCPSSTAVRCSMLNVTFNIRVLNPKMRPRVLQDASNPPRETPEEASKRLHEGYKSPSSDHPLSNQPNLRVKDNQNHSIHTVLSKTNKMIFIFLISTVNTHLVRHCFHQSASLLTYEEKQTLARASSLAPPNTPFPTGEIYGSQNKLMRA